MRTSIDTVSATPTVSPVSSLMRREGPFEEDIARVLEDIELAKRGGNGRQRQNANNGAPRTSQQRQESLGHTIRAVEIDGEALFERGTIAQVVIKRQACVVNEDIERFDFLHGRLNLRSVGYVQREGRHAAVSVLQFAASSTRVNPLRSASECLGDERSSDAAIGAGDQDCLVLNVHTVSPLEPFC